MTKLPMTIAAMGPCLAFPPWAWDFRHHMNHISSVLRIVSGLAILILCISMYRNMAAQLAAGGQLQLFGQPTGASSGQLTIGFVVIGLIGLFLLVIGIVSLLRSR